MPSAANDLQLLELYVAQELQLASLYELFASRFPALRQEWLQLAREEQEHAAWIRHLGEAVHAGQAHFEQRKTRKESLVSFGAYLRSMRERFNRGAFDGTRALTLARDIEKALIERDIFRQFTGDAPNVRKTLAILQEESRAHLQRLERLCARGAT